MITITVKPGTLGDRGQMWEAIVDDNVIVTAREPFFAAARALLKLGADPSTPIQMKHAGSDVISLKSTVGYAAGLTVAERSRGGIYHEPFKERPDLEQAEQ